MCRVQKPGKFVEMVTAQKRMTVGALLRRLLFITLGAIIMGLGLEGILVPNHIIDGGVTGVSMILSHIAPIRLGTSLFILNIPFFILGYKQIGERFAISMLYGVSVLSISTFFIHNLHPIVTDSLLAVVYGGLLLGLGVGLVLRSGGVLDGTETLAIVIEKKVPFSIGEIIMFTNVIIFTLASFVFGLTNALYSMLTYYIAYRTIDVVVKGLDDMKSIYVISEYNQEIADSITDQLGRGITFLNGEGSVSDNTKRIVFCIFTRLEESSLKDIIREIDPSAFLIISDVAEVKGGRFKKNNIH